MLRRAVAASWVLLSLLSATSVRATETENFGIRVLPAPGPLKIDGRADDWDLSGGIFACGDVEKQRDKYGVWFHAMYDAEMLYLLARFNDDTPLNNTGDTQLDFGWNGDSIQVRVVTAAGTPQEQKSVLNCWKGRDGRDVVELDSPPRTRHTPKGDDVKPLGALQAFQVEKGTGYVQEIAVPWKLLGQAATAPKTGDSIVMTIEPNFTLGADSRWSIKDIFRAGVPLDRVFTFQNSGIWGQATLVGKGQVEPQPVRLSDGRQFAVHLERGLPVVDWTGLIKLKQRPGFKPIAFDLPADSRVSLLIKDARGEIVRQLLTAELLPTGPNSVQWDGLATGNWKTPGEPVEPGEYTWSALYHPGIGLKWRGFASNAGRVPWDNGPGTNWGGDMGPPQSVAAEGDRVLLGWMASEAGKAAVLCDLSGNPIWSHKRGGFGGAPFVGLDQGVAYVLDFSVLYKLKASDATIVPWTAGGAGELSIRQLLGDDASVPESPQGMAVKNGKLYLSSSNYEFSRSDVADWRALLAQLAASKPGEPVNLLWAKLPGNVQTRVAAWLTTNNPIDHLQAAGTDPDARDELVKAANALLNGPELGAPAGLTGAALQSTNRQRLETLHPALLKRSSGFVAVIDAASGKLLHRVPSLGAGKLAADERGVFALVAGTSVVYLDAESSKLRPVLSDLQSVQAIAVDAKGNLYLGSGADNQVSVYSPDGKLRRTIGRKGGRAPTGPWQAEGLRNIAGLCTDSDNKLWVAESLVLPSRFSRWSAETGKLEAEFFGPTHYGASGGAILPADPNIMVGEACEWQLDPQTGRGTCTAVLDHELHAFARFAKGSNGKDYLMAISPSFIGAGFGTINIKIFERLGLGQYKLRSSIRTYGQEGGETPRTEFWADANDDQQRQPAEIQVLPRRLRLGGYYLWSMFVNTDLRLYAVEVTPLGHTDPQGGVLLFKASAFTAADAPRYDVAGAQKLPLEYVESNLPSRDNHWLLANIQRPGQPEWYTLFDLQNNRPAWRYLNNWSGVHGSHNAPPAEPGLLRGVFGMVGTARLPEPVGDVWALNSNLGEWHLLTRDGFYLSRLFQPDAIQFSFPKEARPGVQIDDIPAGMGMEDFGGSLQQAPDGKVYVQAGKTALWNLEVTGLDQVRALPGGKISISADEVAQAQKLRESLLQEVAGTRLAEVKKLTPQFTGNLQSDFPGVTVLTYQKTDETQVRSALAYDDQNLYLGWEVKDPTPWVNSADAAEYMYARGDSVDFQLGTDPAADPKRNEAVRGDLRLSIGQVAGKPMAVLYRKVAVGAGDKHPHTFASGVIREYVMESVRVLPDAKIEVKVDAAGKRYVVEAAIPQALLDLRLTPGLLLLGDMGVTHSNPSGDDTRLRTYWSNQETGLVDDEVYELMLKPSNWGQFKF